VNGKERCRKFELNIRVDQKRSENNSYKHKKTAITISRARRREKNKRAKGITEGEVSSSLDMKGRRKV
jgi:hypothetical protein